MLWHSADCWFCEKYIFISPGRWSFPAEIVVYWVILTEDVYQVWKSLIFVCLYALLSCFCTHVCFHLKSNKHIVKTCKNRIPFQTFDKWHSGGKFKPLVGLGAGAKDKNLVGRNFSRWGNDQIFGCNNANLPALTRCHLHFKVFTPPEQLPFHLHAFLLYQTHQWVMNSECCFLYRSYWIVGNWLPKLQSHLPK